MDVIQAAKLQIEQTKYSPNVIWVRAKYNRLPRKLKKKLTPKQRIEIMVGFAIDK